MKKKLFKTVWNGLVTLIPIILPLIVQHKDTIIKHSKKIK